jgi:hypothetical protein
MFWTRFMIGYKEASQKGVSVGFFFVFLLLI